MSRRDILEIRNQSFSSLLANFQICRECAIVDMDQNRIRVDYICPVCNKPGNCGMLYFNLGVRSLIDLIQESYNSRKIIYDDNEHKFEADSHAHYLSIVIFFITLREVLLQNFMNEIVFIKNISESIYERLLADNRNYSKKQKNVFKALLDIKWETAVKEANDKDKIDYVGLNDLLKKVVNARNKFLHEGIQYAISKELAEECILNIWPLINLYVRFHNDYVHPHYLNKCT
jgi:dihydroneopterin aldolase